MRIFGLLAGLAIMLVVTGATTGGTDKSEAKALQGNWVMVAIEVGGVAKEKEFDLENAIRWTIKNANYTVRIFGEVAYQGAIEIDDGRRPKTFNLREAGGDRKVWLGIYDLQGDTLRICYNVPGEKERPMEFSTKGKEGFTVMVLRREKKEK